MLRKFITIIAIILAFGLSATAAESYMVAPVSKAAKKTKKKKSTARKTAPAIKVNTDSIEAARRDQAARDSVDVLQTKVDMGDIPSINELGLWYFHGHNVEKDYNKAVALWRKGAQVQSPRSLGFLAMCYEHGYGVEPDADEAAKLYTESIRCGNGTLLKQMLDSAATNAFDAMIVAQCFEKGDGVKPDLRRAADLYAMAVDNGANHAVTNAALCYMAVGDTINALKYLPDGAKSGNVPCKYWTGVLMLADPAISTKETADAVQMIVEAADCSMPEAMDFAATLYAKGKYLAKDQRKAYALYSQAALMDYPSAMWHLGQAYSQGMATDTNFDRALYWMARAVDAGYGASLNDIEPLAYAYYLHGMKALLCDADFVDASQWFKSSEKLSRSGDGKIMATVTLGHPDNPKANTQKALKTLEKEAPHDARAAYWLALLYQELHDGDRAKALKHVAQENGYANDLEVLVIALSMME